MQLNPKRTTHTTGRKTKEGGIPKLRGKGHGPFVRREGKHLQMAKTFTEKKKERYF